MVTKRLALFYLLMTVLLITGSADAQQPKKVPVIGYLSSTVAVREVARAEKIRLALRERGYVEGENIVIEYRYAEGKRQRYAELAADLVRLKVDLIVASGGAATVRAAMNATKTIPIVMGGAGLDPVKAGLVESLARPGGNVTGVTRLITDLSSKRLELLKESVPKLARVGVLYDPATQSSVLELKEVETAAHAFQLTIRPWEARVADDFDKVFATLSKERLDGLFVSRSPLINNNENRIVGLALKSRLPSMYTGGRAVVAGGLMYYGADEMEADRRVAYFVDRILKGAKPADLPVEQPMKFEFVVNLKTAKQIGLTIPPEVLTRATKLIK